MTHAVLKKLRRFCVSEDGTGVVPVILWTPLMLGIAVSTVDLGAYTLRQVSLERALDQAIREVKLDTSTVWTHDALKTEICARSSVLTNCNELLNLEMLGVDMRDYVAPDDKPSCTDTIKLFTVSNEIGEDIPLTDRLTPARNFQNGIAHQTMILRACYKYKTATPGSFLAGAGVSDELGYTAVVSTGIFVYEPT
ncbi:pilus assembly protein [Salipiger sp. 1_MG-2023]|uniref:TadE/TadG family type IV pilus assembly protein n=1 Tax=Salipiger sp. 1_MG-2023 TaxID=3062665 RepID=UPI0026E1DAF5|nr:pilus assembly protein [Salipiger sp. 1_MG-2023]MDO6585400.1 pilus assembly protein [Salipiger sp. 1_MG-2023]